MPESPVVPQHDLPDRAARPRGPDPGVDPDPVRWMKIGQLALHTGVPSDTLRAWERRYALLHPRRTAGNQRLYSNLDEQRVRIMRGHLAFGTPAALAAERTLEIRMGATVGTEQVVGPAEVLVAHRDLREALDAFDETAGQRVLERLFLAHSRLAVLRDVLLPYMSDVGRRWTDAHLTIAQEHFASSFLEVRLMAVARGWDRGSGPRALLACAPGERHSLGLVCFGIALHQQGWRIVNLGADTPIEVVADAAEQIDADLVVVTASLGGRLVDGPVLRGLAATRRCAIGGSGALEGLAERIGAEFLSGDPVSAALALGEGRGPRPTATGGIGEPGQDVYTAAGSS
ncbi:MerR family transcriptional regulator [Patulibacter sp.]|uniref:MerR family transcriptional regulator n=1 Tax=Patulibacter sp. TaxID=1912859 RepID=UPI002720032D|nr:MerR family transcriptional regulator [Patulibacter sp.]MDO9410851.1 MerR family transcriptional regulator [Patulibacter sp.]